MIHDLKECGKRIDYSGQLAHALKCVQRMGTAV